MVYKWSILITVPCVPRNNLYLAIAGWYLYKYQLGELSDRVVQVF